MAKRFTGEAATASSTPASSCQRKTAIGDKGTCMGAEIITEERALAHTLGCESARRGRGRTRIAPAPHRVKRP